MTPQIKKLTTSEVVEDKTERMSSGEFSRDSSKEICSFFVCFFPNENGCIVLPQTVTFIPYPLGFIST